MICFHHVSGKRTRARGLFLGGSFDPVRTDEKVRWNFPRFANFVDHVDREWASPRENFRCARPRVQKLGQFYLGVPEFLDGIVEDVDRIKALVDIDRPSLCFIKLDKCEEHVKPVTLLGALRGTPAGVDLGQRGPVIFVRTDRPDLHQLFPLELRYGQSIDAVVLCMGADELHECYLPLEIESDYQAVISSRNFEPDALAVQHLGFRSRSLDFISRGPMRGSDEFVPAFERNLCLRMFAPKAMPLSIKDPEADCLARALARDSDFD